MEEISEHRRRRFGADQPLGFEDLDRLRAQMFVLGVKQAAVRTADAIWTQRLLQIVGLQEDAKARDGAFLNGSRRQRGQRRPDVLLDLRGDGDVLAHQDRDDPVGGPGTLGNVVNASERLQ